MLTHDGDDRINVATAIAIDNASVLIDGCLPGVGVKTLGLRHVDSGSFLE